METDKIQFLEYIESNFGHFQEREVPIAKVLFNGAGAFIYTTCPCFPSTKGRLVKGDFIHVSTEIGYFAAEGDDIPYDKPYAKIVKA